MVRSWFDENLLYFKAAYFIPFSLNLAYDQETKNTKKGGGYSSTVFLLAKQIKIPLDFENARIVGDLLTKDF